MTAVADTISGLVWRVMITPDIIKDNYNFCRLKKDPDYYEKLHKKESEKEKAKALKAEKKIQSKANKAAKETKTNDVGPITKEIINDVAEDTTDKVNLEAKARAGQGLINYTIYVMANIPEVNDPSKSLEEKEIINGIAAIFNYGKIFKDATIADLSKYEPGNENYLCTSNYILSRSDIERRLGDEILAEQIKRNRESAGKPEPTAINYESWKIGEDGFVHPIFIHPESEVQPIIEEPVQGDLSDEMFNRLESVVNQMIVQSKHRYEQLPNGLVNLYITRNTGIEVPYVLDPGIVMGRGEVSILGRTENDTIFIPIMKFLDIAKSVANNDFYQLQAAEVAKVTNHYALYPNCFTYIDMSNTEWLSEWSFDEQIALKTKIASIVNIMYNEFKDSEKPRFRFNSHVNSDDFILISDPGVKSPLESSGETSNYILPGYMYQVAGNTVTRLYRTMDPVQYNI